MFREALNKPGFERSSVTIPLWRKWGKEWGSFKAISPGQQEVEAGKADKAMEAEEGIHYSNSGIEIRVPYKRLIEIAKRLFKEIEDGKAD